MKLTPIILREAYDFLKTTPPFNRWNLIDGEEIIFKVTRSSSFRGYFSSNKKIEIGISEKVIGHVHLLIETLSHEMIHLHQYLKKTDTTAQHNAEFHKLAKLVCKHHGYDIKAFV